MSAYLLVAAYFQKMAERRDGLGGDILRLPLAKIAIPNKLFVDILRLIALLRQSPDPEAA